MTGYTWIKTLHVVFVIAWFSGLFYLPRIYVNLAEDNHPAVRERLLGMARRLLRFMTGLGAVAIIAGMVLLGGYGVGAKAGWMHAKLALVLLLIVYHAYCAVLLHRFAADTQRRSSRWFRWFNEVPVLLLAAIIALVVGKPF